MRESIDSRISPIRQEICKEFRVYESMLPSYMVRNVDDVPKSC